MVKKRLDLRIEEDLRDGIDLEAKRTGKPLTAIVEGYIRDGLARDHGQLIELNSLPEIRVAVRQETEKALGQLYEQLSADLTKAARRSDDRLAKLAANSVRNGGIAWRMVYALIGKLVNKEFAQHAYADAKAKAGQALQSEDEP